MEYWSLVGLAIGVVLIVVALFAFSRGKRQVAKKRELPPTEDSEGHAAGAAASAAVAKKIEAPTVAQPQVAVKTATLGDKLSKSRGSLFGRLERFFSRGSLDTKEWDELEEILIEADVGVSTTQKILGGVRDELGKNGSDLRALVGDQCRQILRKVEPAPLVMGDLPKPWIVSIVGVNGVGKTTTIGKLTKFFIGSGKTVLLGAADTFRAGAINQLKTWADREGAQFVTGREGGDPGAVAFDACTAAKARGVDVVLLDTAGRLHTKTSLMDELKKVHRVMKKVIPEAPHETWLVLDGNLGQNSLSQAKEFQKALELTGIIVTKLDGTAKGGAVLGIAAELGLPVRFIGVGESSADFMPFNADHFVDAIVSG